MRNEKYALHPLFMAELPKFSRLFRKSGSRNTMLSVRFFIGSGNTAVMRNASGHNYWNSSFIMDVAMGQIPRSTERISIVRHISSTAVLC